MNSGDQIRTSGADQSCGLKRNGCNGTVIYYFGSDKSAKNHLETGLSLEVLD